jgi:hypothetical protein
MIWHIRLGSQADAGFFKEIASRWAVQWQRGEMNIQEVWKSEDFSSRKLGR